MEVNQRNSNSLDRGWDEPLLPKHTHGEKRPQMGFLMATLWLTVGLGALVFSARASYDGNPYEETYGRNMIVFFALSAYMRYLSKDSVFEVK